MFDDPAAVASMAFAFRIGERMLLSAVLVLLALVVTVGFWRTVQKVDFSLAKAGASGTLVLTTPVLALFALIGFAWVSFSHPITVTVPATADGTARAEAPVAVSMIGAAQAVSDHDRQAVTQDILGLNCVASKALAASTPGDADVLARVKTRLMRAVWADDWGDPDSLETWALGLSTDPPPDAARRIFEGVHPLC